MEKMPTANKTGTPCESEAADGCAELAAQWIATARALADNCFQHGDRMPEMAERMKARAETYLACANQLQDKLRSNKKNIQ